MIDHRDADCLHWREQLVVLPPDKLSPSDQRALDAHLRSCPTCTSVHDQYRTLSAALWDLSSDAPPPGLPPRLLQLWEEQAVQQTDRPARSDNRKPSLLPLVFPHVKSHPVRMALAGIAAAILIVSIFLGSFFVHAPSPKGGSSVPFMYPSPVTFAPSISYEQALRIVTDLGLQPALDCGLARLTPGAEQVYPQWQPMGQKVTFLSDHRLFVTSTYSAPSDWRLRLRATPGVQIGVSQGSICQSVVYGTPPPGIAIPLTSAQAGTYVRVTFAHPIDTYDAALYTVVNTGLALADFCYEQDTLFKHQELVWHPVGQGISFARTHTLIVTTTKRVTSSLWLEQLRATPGVVAIASPFTTSCP